MILDQLVPALILTLLTLTTQFEAAVPGATLRPISGHRSHAEQAELYAQGRTKPGPIVTKARPGESNHNRYPSPAVDVVVVCRGVVSWSARADCDGDGVSDYLEMGRLAEKLGLVWGGSWKGFPDPPHLELPAGTR